jgi:hypothetical protein
MILTSHVALYPCFLPLLVFLFLRHALSVLCSPFLMLHLATSFSSFRSVLKYSFFSEAFYKHAFQNSIFQSPNCVPVWVISSISLDWLESVCSINAVCRVHARHCSRYLDSSMTKQDKRESLFVEGIHTRSVDKEPVHCEPGVYCSVSMLVIAWEVASVTEKMEYGNGDWGTWVGFQEGRVLNKVNLVSFVELVIN